MSRHNNADTHMGYSVHPLKFDKFSTQHDQFHPTNYYSYRSPPIPNAEHPEVIQSIIGENEFLVSLDVHRFAPKDISVKTVGHCVVVEATHDERPDESGHITRNFSRRFTLPAGFNPNYVVPELSVDGVLTIKGTPEHRVSKEERVLEIRYTGPVLFRIKNQDESEAGAEAEAKDEETN